MISQKSITGKQLSRLQEEIVVILCELEMYFPPAFFDICVHLLFHIMDDFKDYYTNYLLKSHQIILCRPAGNPGCYPGGTLGPPLGAGAAADELS